MEGRGREVEAAQPNSNDLIDIYIYICVESVENRSEINPPSLEYILERRGAGLISVFLTRAQIYLADPTLREGKPAGFELSAIRAISCRKRKCWRNDNLLVLLVKS